MTCHAAWHLTELASGYWKAAAIGAAVSLGVFEKLTEPAGADEVAAACGIEAAYTADLLAALAAMDLLEQRDDLFVLTTKYRPLLDPDSPQCMLGALQLNNDLYSLWGRLDACVREGRPAVGPGDHLGGDADQTRRFVMAMHGRAAALGPAIVDAIDLAGCRSLLDLASGPGTLSRMLAGRHETVSVSQFDLPPVLDVARQLTPPGPLADRIHFHSGDYRNDPLPVGFDAVLYCGALHQETPASAAALLGRVHEAMNPGGRLFVVDFLRERRAGAPTGDPFAALFALQMKLFNADAGVFDTDTVIAMLQTARFSDIHARRLDPTAYRLVEARRTA
ncbi:MAG: methyltransferase domain-containing protein [Deinococcus-Thermus bacterium]|jgi:SAM-dependent methyltransferase|nr:methyltransferase domain-containing protein [Deinococcota bacterium]